MANLNHLMQTSLQKFLASLIGQSVGSVSKLISSILEPENKTPDLEKLSTLSELDNYWNDGIKDIIHDYKELYNNKRIFDINEEPYNSISTIDVKSSDAQYQQSLDKNFSNFVIPQKNYKNDYYSAIRGEDFFIKIANDRTNLQYTNNKRENNRLLMPKNSRRVEIEDLNKNFWVISQQLSIICNTLFNPKSYQNKIMNGIIEQILKIWDTILLLWLGVSKVFQDNTLIFFLPITFGSSSVDKKFDNIDYEKYDDSVINQEIHDQCYSLCKKYQNSNLFIFPLLRGNNYYKNYFSKIKIPFYYRKEKGSNEMMRIIQNNQKEIISIDIEQTQMFDNQNFTEQLYGFRERESSMEFYYPFNRNLFDSEKQKIIKDQIEDNNDSFEVGLYCAIRIVPKVELTMNSRLGIMIRKIDFDIYDLAEELLNQSPETPETIINQEIMFYKKKYSKKIGNIRLSEKTSNAYGHYMGEVLSCRKTIRVK